MHRTITLLVLLGLGVGICISHAAAAVEPPKSKDTLVPAAKPESDAGAKDPADFPRPQGLVRRTYSQAAGKLRDEEIATYHAKGEMDETAAQYLERLQATGWKKGSDSVSGSGTTRVRMIEWTLPGKEAEVRFYAVKGSGSNVRVRIFTYKTTPPQAAITTAATTPTTAKTGAGTPPPLSPEVTVPNLVGKPVAEADSLLKDVGLKAKVNPGKTMTDLKTPGVVAEQSPLPEQKVKRGSTVTLTPWGSLIAVSDVVGVPLDTAQKILGARQLHSQVGPAKQDLVGVGGKAQNGLVAEQHPAAGQAVALDSTVTLVPWVSRVIVPDVTGLPLAQAASQLGAHQLKYKTGSAKQDNVPPGGSPKNGLVAEQNPDAGKTVALDSTVTLTPWISRVRVPDFRDQPLAQAESQLTALQLKFELGHVMVSPAGTTPQDGLVGKQSPRHGEWLNVGATVTLNPWASPAEVPNVIGETLAHAESLLAARGLQYEVGPAKPDAGASGPSSKDGVVAEQHPAARLTVNRGSVVTLIPWATGVHLGHMEGMPLVQAENLLTARGLQAKVAPGKVIPANLSNSEDGNVAEQNPHYGETVAAGSTVILTPWIAHVAVPDVTGQTLAQAENLLSAQQFQYQVGSTKPDTGTTGPSPKDGLVAEQHPAARQVVAKGSSVTLTPWGTAAHLDRVTGMPLAQAENLLTSRGFKYQVAPGKPIPPSQPGAEAGRVAEQDPNPTPGLKVAQGSTVVLTPWVVPVIVPDLKTWPLEQAKNALTGRGLQLRLGAEIPNQVSARDGLVGLQSPAADQAVAPGSVVTLQVYHGAARANP